MWTWPASEWGWIVDWLAMKSKVSLSAGVGLLGGWHWCPGFPSGSGVSLAGSLAARIGGPKDGISQPVSGADSWGHCLKGPICLRAGVGLVVDRNGDCGVPKADAVMLVCCLGPDKADSESAVVLRWCLTARGWVQCPGYPRAGILSTGE